MNEYANTSFSIEILSNLRSIDIYGESDPKGFFHCISMAEVMLIFIKSIPCFQSIILNII